MRYLVLSIALIFPCLATAEKLCPENEAIAEHARIQESYLTKSNAREALRQLEAIVLEGKRAAKPTDVLNAMKVIQGYILKKEYLDNRNTPLGEWKLSEFCLFMQHSAWWYD